MDIDVKIKLLELMEAQTKLNALMIKLIVAVKPLIEQTIKQFEAPNKCCGGCKD